MRRRLVGAAGALALVGCQAVLGIPDRERGDHVACSDGACACEASFADCDGDPATGCEVDLQHDDANCGACGHDCRGAACDAGMCTPVRVAKENCLSGLAVDGDDVLWTDCFGDLFVAGADAQVTRLARKLDATGLDVHEHDAIWMASTSVQTWDVLATPEAGGATTPLLHDVLADFIDEVRVAADSVVWTSELTGSSYGTALSSAPLAGGAIETLATGAFIASFAPTASGRRICWATQHAVHAIDRETGARTEVASGVSPFEVAADGEACVFTDDGGGVYRAEPGETAARWIEGGGRTTSIAAFGGAVVWADADRGAILLREADGTTRTLADATPDVQAIAMGAEWVAWATSTDLQRVPR